jgi:hypothetical protein
MGPCEADPTAFAEGGREGETLGFLVPGSTGMAQEMPGRSNFLRLGAALLVLIGSAAAVGWLLFVRATNPFRTASPFDVAAYSSGARGLSGNTCTLEGEILALLAWAPSGRLVSVSIGDGRTAVPVLVPSEYHDVDLPQGLRFRFLLQVDDQGILRVKQLSPS